MSALSTVTTVLWTAFEARLRGLERTLVASLNGCHCKNARKAHRQRGSDGSLHQLVSQLAWPRFGARTRASPLRRDGYRLRRLRFGLLDDELPVHRVHVDGVARVELALKEHLRKRVGDLVLDLPRQRPSAEVRVVADRGDVVLRFVGDDERDFLRGELLAHALKLELHDLADLGLGERCEHHRRVDAVEELRAEEALHLFLYALLHPLVLGVHVGIVALTVGAEA